MPYGVATHSGNSQTPYQWLGGYGVYYDHTTELHLTTHRAYSADMRKFISPDPLGIDGGVNVYAYANLNPLFFVDPDGKCGVQNRVEYNMPGYGDAQSYQIVGGNTRNLTESNWAVAGRMYGAMAMGTARGTTLGDIETLADKNAGLGWKALAVASIGLDIVGIGEIPGTSTGTLRAGRRAMKTRVFRHYGFADDASKFKNGLRPGAYATHARGRPMKGITAQQKLALPHDPIPDAYYKVRVGSDVRVNGPGPVQSTQLPMRPGGGIEYTFPNGTPPGSVEGPFFIQ